MVLHRSSRGVYRPLAVLLWLVILIPSGARSAVALPECGSGWSIVPSPNTDTRRNSLSGVTALAVDDVWAVGERSAKGPVRTPVQRLPTHRDGSWSRPT
jgi:hypothetical protein